MAWSKGAVRPAWHVAMAILAVASVALVFWYEAAADPVLRSRLAWIDLAIVVLFAAEWIYRLLRHEDKARFLRRNWYDLPGMIPLLVMSGGFMRLFRLARIFRVLQLVPGFRRRLVRLQAIIEHGQIGALALAASAITLAGSFLVWLAERPHNPEFVNYSEALWWSIVTVTTVGYGDITPETPLGRALAVTLMVVGIGIIGTLASQVSTAVMRRAGSEAGGDVEKRLRQLARLHRDRIITDAEFAAAKQDVLGITASQRQNDE